MYCYFDKRYYKLKRGKRKNEKSYIDVFSYINANTWC